MSISLPIALVVGPHNGKPGHTNDAPLRVTYDPVNISRYVATVVHETQLTKNLSRIRSTALHSSAGTARSVFPNVAAIHKTEVTIAILRTVDIADAQLSVDVQSVLTSPPIE